MYQRNNYLVYLIDVLGYSYPELKKLSTTELLSRIKSSGSLQQYKKYVKDNRWETRTPERV